MRTLFSVITVQYWGIESNLQNLRCMGTPPCFFSHFYKGKQFLWLPACFSRYYGPSKKVSTPTGKILFLEEQILSLKILLPSRREAKMNLAVASPESAPIYPIMCTLQRLRSACMFVQSDQSPHCTLHGKVRFHSIFLQTWIPQTAAPQINWNLNKTLKATRICMHTLFRGIPAQYLQPTCAL